MPPFPYHRINIVGAPGSETSTLACALATEIGGRFIDADDFYWKPTDPPFRDKVDTPARLSALLSAMAERTCRVMRFDGDQPVSDRVQAIVQGAARHAC
ncbi:hypothetical protein [Pigmentiphaga litoralis]|uniref:Shikimate kinase n=1 Tax=Pigmentiphaga litoralis TaxID=516702 RepID=A0A7Y9LMD5_9BURK|nr:hypothetical protein [Pigmentiphaga litoralis]NYE24383.1 hypothetical protein [Pigmentiphaga litoralis]NYE82003.1 hypothetical protein [Pigmentiphaga litoralis]